MARTSPSLVATGWTIRHGGWPVRMLALVAALTVALLGVSAPAYASTVPDRVTKFGANQYTGQYQAVWSAPASNGGAAIDNYRVYTGSSSSGPWSLAATVTPSAGFMFYTLSGNRTTLYYVKVVAHNVNGEGPDAILGTTTNTISNPEFIGGVTGWSGNVGGTVTGITDTDQSGQGHNEDSVAKVNYTTVGSYSEMDLNDSPDSVSTGFVPSGWTCAFFGTGKAPTGITLKLRLREYDSGGVLRGTAVTGAYDHGGTWQYFGFNDATATGVYTVSSYAGHLDLNVIGQKPGGTLTTSDYFEADDMNLGCSYVYA